MDVKKLNKRLSGCEGQTSVVALCANQGVTTLMGFPDASYKNADGYS